MPRKKQMAIIGTLIVVLATSVIYLSQGQIASTKSPATQQIQTNTTEITPATVSAQKVAIRDKMLNAVDYFENVQGVFERQITALNLTSTIAYIVDTESGYSKETIQDTYAHAPKRNRILEKIYFPNEAYLMEIDHRTKSYQIHNTIGREEMLKVVQAQRQKIKNNSLKLSGHIIQSDFERSDPNYLMAPDSVFPKQIAISFLGQLNQWELIDEGMLLDRNVTIIYGSFEDYYADKYKAKTFKLWVDQETGILLQYEAYTTSGIVTPRKSPSTKATSPPIRI